MEYFIVVPLVAIMALYLLVAYGLPIFLGVSYFTEKKRQKTNSSANNPTRIVSVSQTVTSPARVAEPKQVDDTFGNQPPPVGPPNIPPADWKPTPAIVPAIESPASTSKMDGEHVSTGQQTRAIEGQPNATVKSKTSGAAPKRSNGGKHLQQWRIHPKQTGVLRR